MMRRSYWSVLLGLVFILAACQSGSEKTVAPAPSAALEIQRIERTFTEPDCSGNHCAKISVDYLRFTNDEALSAELRRRLLATAGGISDASKRPASSLEGYADLFFKEARAARTDSLDTAPYYASLNAEAVTDNADLLIIALDNYVFVGGAHGMPLTQYMVIDQRNREIVTLDDMLLEGRRNAFDAALERAHHRWLDEIGQDTEFALQWPLSVSDNVAPLANDVVVRYQVYELGPYALGQPELRIPYAELEGVFKPRYLR